MNKLTIESNSSWSGNQLFWFRSAFIFFIIMSVPLQWSWFERLFAIDIFDLTYRDLYEISGYNPRIWSVPTESGRWGLASFTDWLIIFIIALAGAAIWSYFVRNKKTKAYNNLYYWIQVIVRYRVAAGLITFGYVKLFPVQMPAPSITVLNTEIINILSQKLYWSSVGIVTWYEVFLGFAEIFAGALMFSRRSSSLGACLTIGVLFNIFLANIYYDGGVHVYALYFVPLSLFLLIQDFPKVWQLLANEKDTLLNRYRPALNRTAYYTTRGLKYLFIGIYLPFQFYIMYSNHYIEVKVRKQPVQAGLKNSAGYYEVSEFKLNGKTIPYSPYDTVRWQTATFEKWTTFTYRVNKPFFPDLSNGGPAKKDIDRNFEYSGVAGGQRFLYYEADTTNHALTFYDKNLPPNVIKGKIRSSKRERDLAEKSRITFTLTYSRPTISSLVLSGLNEQKDSLYIVLNKIDKRYPLIDGRRQLATNSN
ncbi:hypothetical protein SAMN05216436_11488 [bacterium A37T11]|nr:hypothetical protein SAMN05216436_11488 [bacterium A37T11]